MSDAVKVKVDNYGLRKATSLLLGLNVDASSKVLQHLADTDLEKVMYAISEGGSQAKDVYEQAVEEAHSMVAAGGPSLLSGGIDLTRQLLAKSVGPQRGANILDKITTRKQLSSFDILRNADPIRMAELLGKEHPQTIALVLSYLDSKQAAEMLTHMTAALQIDVTLRLSTMDRVAPNVVEIIEQGLKSKISNIISEVDFKATGGVDFLVQMLNQVDRGVQKNILDALQETNPVLVDEIKANMFTFDDLNKLDDRTMQRIMRDVNKQDLALGLKSASENLRDHIYKNMSGRARENLKEEVEILGPQLAKNVYAAQRKIVDVVRTLEEEEEIVINVGGGGDDEIIT